MTGQHAGMQSRRLLVPGRNCWRIEHSDRLAFLIDGAAYFAAVRSAIAQAKRSVFILAWDFDSHIQLVSQGADDGYPEKSRRVSQRSDPATAGSARMRCCACTPAE